ncbi:hypothetical protein NJC40_00020 [Pseudomonas sp. 21LCFQ02]|uniref:hypothetical protein n=1 Tax=Pseudomonas sp. 21LCFQ02 TaxID=2957505 RepID=UPI00209B2B94|nr:hypothetical protein [Pseudomonas sp. 21LCFQ02]MCO8166168.1 hypothetical protein [Pseudomonas sp. 21LCFQ02]
MPLSTEQVKKLRDAVNSYSFPTAHFDFIAKKPVIGLSMLQLETRIRQQLLSASPEQVKDGLSNVLYWGFAQMGGLGPVRVERFRSAVSIHQLQQASGLFTNRERPALYEIAELGLPQFSKVSFVSKIRMYLDPVKSATLDRQIMQMHQIHTDTVLAAFKQYSTSIPTTKGNSAAYESWCDHLGFIAQAYLPTARVVDIERGLFQIIQEGDVSSAADILKNA